MAMLNNQMQTEGEASSGCLGHRGGDSEELCRWSFQIRMIPDRETSFPSCVIYSTLWWTNIAIENDDL